MVGFPLRHVGVMEVTRRVKRERIANLKRLTEASESWRETGVESSSPHEEIAHSGKVRNSVGGEAERCRREE